MNVAVKICCYQTTKTGQQDNTVKVGAHYSELHQSFAKTSGYIGKQPIVLPLCNHWQMWWATSPPPLAQARPWSQKSRQNSGPTAMPGIAMLAMAKNHIKTDSMGLQCVVQCWYEQNAQSQT